MSIDISVSGAREAAVALLALTTALDEAAKENVTKMAAQLIADAQANFAGSHPKGMPHVPAGNTAFGPMPNIVTGTLRRSIRGDGIRRVGHGTYSTTVGPQTVYARRVELGLAPTGSYPYFGPAVAKLRTNAPAIIGASINRHLR